MNSMIGNTAFAYNEDVDGLNKKRSNSSNKIIENNQRSVNIQDLGQDLVNFQNNL